MAEILVSQTVRMGSTASGDDRVPPGSRQPSRPPHDQSSSATIRLRGRSSQVGSPVVSCRSCHSAADAQEPVHRGAQAGSAVRSYRGFLEGDDLPWVPWPVVTPDGLQRASTADQVRA